MTYRIYSEVTDYGRGRRIAIVRDVDGDRLEVVQAMTVKVIDRYTVVGDSDWTLSDLTLGRQRVDQILQALLDHAWELGMRPKGFFDTMLIRLTHTNAEAY